MYDSTAILISEAVVDYDSAGNPIKERTFSEVFVQPRSVYQSEVYNAAQIGLRPSLTLFIANREDYHEERVLEYKGREYSVIRTDWNAQRDGISLICEERSQNG